MSILLKGLDIPDKGVVRCVLIFSDGHVENVEHRTIKDVEAIQIPSHGRWLRTPTGWVYCSECGNEPPNETNEETDFCPNCGAYMKED